MKKSNPKTSFESNPLKVIVRGLDRLFSTNMAWGVILLVLGLGSIPKTLSSTDTAKPRPDYNFVAGNGIDNLLPILGLGLGILVVALIVGAFVEGILSYVSFKTSKNQKAGFGETISVVYSKFPAIFVTQILTIIRIIGGLLLFVVPGIRAMLRYQFVLFPIFESNASPDEAIAKSKKLTENHLMEILGFSFYSKIVPILGPALGVGALAESYQQLKNLKAGKKSAPKVHWLNSLPIILLALIVLLGMALGMQAATQIKQPHNQNYGVESA